jgi:hypothetical protein
MSDRRAIAAMRAARVVPDALENAETYFDVASCSDLGSVMHVGGAR